MTIFVEVKTKPVFLDKNLNVLIVLMDIVSYFDLMFMKHSDEEGNVVLGLIIDDVEVVLEGIVKLIIEESVKFSAILFQFFISAVVVNVLVCNLIWASLLQLL